MASNNIYINDNNVVGEIKTVSWQFKWVINNFCMVCKNVSEYVQSPKFMASTSKHIQWHLTLYPKGISEESKNFLSLFLHVNAEIAAIATFKILNDKNEAVITRVTDEAVFRKIGRGYTKFASRNYILRPELGLNENKLMILCEVTSLDDGEKTKEVEQDNHIDENEDEDTMDEDNESRSENDECEMIFKRLEELDKYEGLVNRGEFSDVSLIAENKVIKAHKCILAKSSEVFAAMFESEMKEKQDNTVEITDIQYNVLLEMIRFVYAGKVNNIDTIAVKLAVAADKYALNGLKDICEITLCKNLNVENAIESLKIADRHRMDKLKEHTINFIINNAEDITNQSQFKYLPFDVVCEICCALAKNNKNKQH